MPPTELNDLTQRLARVETLIEMHEKDAKARRDRLDKAFEELFCRLNSQQCAVHGLKMQTMEKDIEVLKQSYVNIQESLVRLQIRFAIWTGGLSVIAFLAGLFASFWK